MEVTITEAQTRLSELITRAMQGETVIIQAAGGARVALINKTEMPPAETAVQRAVRVGREMGQSEDILHRIEAGELHPMMAMYGLWRDQDEWDQISEEIYANRERQGSRPAPEL